MVVGCPRNLGDMGVNTHKVPPEKGSISQKGGKVILFFGLKIDKHLLSVLLGSRPIHVYIAATCRMTSFGHKPHGLDLFVSPVDQANKAAEEGPDQGEDDEVSEEYEHPPWRLLPGSLEVTPWLPGGYSLAPWRILLIRLWQQTGQNFSESRRAEEQSEGREGEMQSANKEANNVKLLIRFNLVKVKIKFCQTS